MSIMQSKNASAEQVAVNKVLAAVELTAHHNNEQIRLRREREEKERQAVKTAKLAERHRAIRAKQIADEAEAQKKQNRQNFENALRKRFFEANPNASEGDFQMVLPDLKKEAMLRNMRERESGEEIMKRTGSYEKM